MTCAEVRAALGAELLGALDPAEAAEVQAHLGSCPDCQAARAELVGVPALLAMVSADEVAHAFPEPDASGAAGDAGAAQLERLQARVRAERARDRRRQARDRRARSRRAFLVAAVVTALVGAGGWAAGRWVTPVQPVAQPTAQPTPRMTAAPVHWSASDPTTKIVAKVTLNPVSWGTKVDIELQGVKKGDMCSLVVYDRSGRKWDGGSWTVAYDRGIRWSGGVAVPTDQVMSIEVHQRGDQPIVRIAG
jgi:Putative zinc-finger